MANDARTDAEKRESYTIDLSGASSGIIKHRLHPDQEEQVREIIREEIEKAIKKLIETVVIGN